MANNFDVKWVMSQVGHADSKMTMDVYAQLEQRVDRRHGTAFDSLLSAAREQLEGLEKPSTTLNELANEKATRPGSDSWDKQK